MNQKSEKPVAQSQPVPAKVTEIGKAQTKEAKSESGLPTQREAVYGEVMRVLKEDKVTFDGTSSVKPHLTEERLKRIYEGLAQGFRAKKIALKDTPSNQKKIAESNLLQAYIVGLVNNWLRRDSRLSGKPAKKS